MKEVKKKSSQGRRNILYFDGPRQARGAYIGLGFVNVVTTDHSELNMKVLLVFHGLGKPKGPLGLTVSDSPVLVYCIRMPSWHVP